MNILFGIKYFFLQSYESDVHKYFGKFFITFEELDEI